ncbi:MAG: ABC transporter permease, partial [Thermotogae bacterium]
MEEEKKLEGAVESVPEVEEEEIEFKEEYLTRRQLIWRAFKRHHLGVGGLVILIILYLMAIFADFLAPYHPYEQSLKHTFAPPTKIHRVYKGKKVKPYVLPVISFVNKTTFTREYYEMLFPNRLVVDSFGQKKIFEIGKDGVTGFKFMITEERYVRLKDGRKKLVSSDSKVVDYFLFGYNEKTLLDGESEVSTESPVAKEVYFGKYGYKLNINSEKDIDRVTIRERLEA